MRSVRGKAITSAKATLPTVDSKEKAAGSSPRLTPAIPELAVAKSNAMTDGQVWGVILGTLGRQGSLLQMEAILRQLETYQASGKASSIPYMPILLSELSPAKLALFNEGINLATEKANITAFIQTSCPRLSIDWGYAFEKPLLNPYEAAVVLGRAKSWEEERQPSSEQGSKQVAKSQTAYPMDFYEAGSVWALSRVKGSETVWPVDVIAH